MDAREIGEQLGVRYVMVGSVRKSRDTVRITAELVRAADRKQLWSDKYDLQLEYIFDIQEEMARQIAATIEPELSKVEQQLAARKAPESLDAWDCYQRGLWNLWRFTTPGFDQAEDVQRAIALILILRAAMARSATSICSVPFSTSRRIARRGWKRRCARGVTRWRSTNSMLLPLRPRTRFVPYPSERRGAGSARRIARAQSEFCAGLFRARLQYAVVRTEIEAETLLDRATMLARATAIFPVSTTSAPGRTSPSASTT